jgi:hypothetical protein
MWIELERRLGPGKRRTRTCGIRRETKWTISRRIGT